MEFKLHIHIYYKYYTHNSINISYRLLQFLIGMYKHLPCFLVGLFIFALTHILNLFIELIARFDSDTQLFEFVLVVIQKCFLN